MTIYVHTNLLISLQEHCQKSVFSFRLPNTNYYITNYCNDTEHNNTSQLHQKSSNKKTRSSRSLNQVT